MFATIYRIGKKIKFYYTHTYYHEAKNEENIRLGLLSEEEQAELIAYEADTLQRLNEIAEDEALALNLQQQEETGLKKNKGGKKRACSNNRGRRIKKRRGRVTKEIEEEVIHQSIQPKEEPQELGKIVQRTRVIHTFSNTKIMPRGSNRTESEKEKSTKSAKEKPIPLNMDMVVACKGVKVSRPREEEIEFELDSKKKVNIPFKQVRKQENDVLKNIFFKLNKNYHPSLEVTHLISDQISKAKTEWGHEKPEKEVLIWNPEGKRVLMEPFYQMFGHDDQGNVRYFLVAEELEHTPNDILERLIDQLSKSDKDELRLRLRMEQQLRINKEKLGDLKEEKKKMNLQINSAKLKVVFTLNLSLYLLYHLI